MTTQPPEKVIEAPAIVVAPASTDEADRQSLGTRQALVLSTSGQRRINLIWEVTQAVIAVSIVLTTCVGVFIGRAMNAVAFPAEWWTIVGLVIGFYYGRTNHARTGGVGGGSVLDDR